MAHPVRVASILPTLRAELPAFFSQLRSTYTSQRHRREERDVQAPA